MDNTITKLADAAWSKMEALFRMRKFIENELDHAQSFPPGFSSEKLHQALLRIDGFTTEFSGFLSFKNSVVHPNDLEEQFDELSHRYAELMQELENTIWR